VEEIDRRLGQEVLDRYHGNWQKAREMAIISDGYIRMAHLAVVGSHSVNGVSQVHSQILQDHLMKNFHCFYPGKFNNKTNGISHRRFLLKANPGLAGLITQTIGPDWVEKPAHLEKLLPFSNDPGFQEKVAGVKRQNKEALARYILDNCGVKVDPASIFDVHIKRIHAYKRQLLNALHIMHLYNRFLAEPDWDIHPRTFIFAGKAAPGYYLAKKIIKLINSLAAKINNDPRLQEKIKVIFLENYNVSLAEMIIPAADVSEQISTASKEASGTGNMKFMMNGAVTLATLDGANIEILEAVGEENIVVFGLTVAEVLRYYERGGYSALEEYHRDPRLALVLEQLVNDFFPDCREEFRNIYNSLLYNNDEFFVLKDFSAYVDAQQRVEQLYRQPAAWNRMCICNIAKSGRFCSDRTILEYARDIWRV